MCFFTIPSGFCLFRPVESTQPRQVSRSNASSVSELGYPDKPGVTSRTSGSMCVLGIRKSLSKRNWEKKSGILEVDEIMILMQLYKS